MIPEYCMKKILILNLFLYGQLHAHIGMLRNQADLEKTLKQHDLVVLLLYTSTDQENALIQKTFAAVSDMKQFLAARVPFRAFNIKGVNGEEIKKKYHILDHFTIVLFRKGLPYTSKFFHGPFDQKKIRKYIERNWDDFIEQRICTRQQERKQQKNLNKVHSTQKKYSHIPVASRNKTLDDHPESPYIFYRPPYNNFCYNPWWYWDWPYGCYNGCAPYSGYCRPALGFGFSVGI